MGMPSAHGADFAGCAERRRLDCLLYFFREFVPELLHLGCHHVRTIWLPGIIGEVFLMIIFGDVECGGGRYFGHDWIVESLSCSQFANHLFGRFALFLGVIEDGGAVLRPCIVALPVERRRIVDGEEDFENVAEAEPRPDRRSLAQPRRDRCGPYRHPYTWDSAGVPPMYPDSTESTPSISS